MKLKDIDAETLRTYLRDTDTQEQYTREEIEKELHRRYEPDVRAKKFKKYGKELGFDPDNSHSFKMINRDK